MSERRTYGFEPDYSCPPGDTLLEELEDRHLTVSELARNSGLQEFFILRLISGSAQIDETTATALENALDFPAGLWLGLERHWQDYLAKDREQQRKIA